MSAEINTAEERDRFRVRLPGVWMDISRLGFGTSALMSRVNRRDSLRLLATAFDEGITHLDTARSYGFGEAELVVGDVLAGRRDRITVTTKVGILPPRRSAGLSAAKALARGLLTVLPGMRSHVRRRAGGLVRAQRFDAAAMTESLHTSLRHLRTDYVDFLLLHEPSVEVLATPEPLAFLERVQRDGKIRHFGVAAESPGMAHALERAKGYTGVLQGENSVFRPLLREFCTGAERAVFAHSIFGTSLPVLGAHLRHRPAEAEHWSRALQMKMDGDEGLTRLALQWALATMPRGVVLFTSTKAAHIRENAAALRAAAPMEQLEHLERLVAEWMQTKESSLSV